ncbi:hypothetical protein ABUE34_09055 [Kozakia baliensis]|uniref:hypothetical protein n=1 Tax=Kozakia baliensis TaxID=153496 RepID=UPI00345BEB4C
MSAASRLWRRAPLWRFSLYSCIFFLVLAAFFPTPRLLHLLPWLSRLPGSTAHHPASQGGPNPPTAPDGQNQAGNNNNEPLSADRVGAPDINASFTGGIPFGGHTLPLPAGTWHPVLSGQIGPDGAMLVNIMVRTDRGIVTGVMIARTNAKPLPAQGVDAIENPCHDDRNFSSHIASEGNNGVLECWRVSRATLNNGTVSSDDLIRMAFERLHTLGFPVPSVFIVTSWVRAAKAQDGGVTTAGVDTLLAPVQPGTVQLLAPLPYWEKNTVTQAPAAQRFVLATQQWMANWSGVLRSGLTAGLPAGIAPLDLSVDPAAPRL